jgi:hypothetical protein
VGSPRAQLIGKSSDDKVVRHRATVRGRVQRAGARSIRIPGVALGPVVALSRCRVVGSQLGEGFVNLAFAEGFMRDVGHS